MTMTAPMFFTAQWADAVREVLRAGPDEAARAAKLAEYWNFYQQVRKDYAASWALGVRDLPSDLGGGTGYLRIAWAGGEPTQTQIVPPGEPAQATYVLDGDYADWKSFYRDRDALRMVMYRKLTLRDGPLLTFFRGILFLRRVPGAIANHAHPLPGR